METSNAADRVLSAVYANSQKNRTPRFRWLRFLPWLYLAFVITATLFMRLAGERWWLATLMLFGPRWLFVIPWCVLAGWASLYRRRSLFPLALSCYVIVGPLMSFCLPWGRLFRANQPAIAIVSCNVKGQCFKNERLNQLIRQSGTDIVALQGCTGPINVDWPVDWNVLQKGELVFASRFPLQRVEPPVALGYNNDHREKVLLCNVVLPQGELRLATVHLLSPHGGIITVVNRGEGLQSERGGVAEMESDERWRQSQVIAQGLIVDAKIDMVVGDFNLTDDNPIYCKYWSSFTDAFANCGLGFGGTERPTAWLPYSVRIDHVLTRGAWQPTQCWVEGDVGSDHLPIVARVVPK